MNDQNILDQPKVYPQLLERCEQIGFTMPSDGYIGTLLKTLVSSKPGGLFLELGTGISLTLSWMVDGMQENAKVISIDNDPELIDIAREYFGDQERVSLVCADGGAWMKSYTGPKFDLIFADAWPGKFWDLEEALDLIKPGGFYVIDDLNPTDDWPEGHAEKVDALVAYLEKRADFNLTKMNWSTGIILAVKI